MATNKCRTTVKRLDCGGSLTTQAKNTYDPFDVCLPFGRSLHYDGQGLRLTGNVTLADGVYGTFTVENGCITDAAAQPVCEYTPEPCTPAATDCSGSSSGSVTLQPGTDNILNYDASGRLGGQINYTAGDNISITGYGTASDPLVISYVAGEASKTYVRAGSSVVPVTGSGTSTDPYVVTHNTTDLGAGTYGSFVIDSFGHVVGYTEQTDFISSILPGNNMEVTHAGAVYTVGLPNQNLTPETYRLGAYDLTVNLQGVITGLTQAFAYGDGSATSYTIDPYFNRITINEFGSILSTTTITRTADDQVSEMFDAGRTDTSFSFTTTKNGYFKVTYKGYLTGASAPSVGGKGYFILSSPFALNINGKKVTAYAHYNPQLSGIDEIIAVSDALYGAGTHTVQVYCSTSGYSFPDIANLTVELVARGS